MPVSDSNSGAWNSINNVVHRAENSLTTQWVVFTKALNSALDSDWKGAELNYYVKIGLPDVNVTRNLVTIVCGIPRVFRGKFIHWNWAKSGLQANLELIGANFHFVLPNFMRHKAISWTWITMIFKSWWGFEFELLFLRYGISMLVHVLILRALWYNIERENYCIIEGGHHRKGALQSY